MGVEPAETVAPVAKDFATIFNRVLKSGPKTGQKPVTGPDCNHFGLNHSPWSGGSGSYPVASPCDFLTHEKTNGKLVTTSFPIRCQDQVSSGLTRGSRGSGY